MNPSPRPSREDVLAAFAVEPQIIKSTLEHYLREYPEYSDDIVDLAAELSREVVVREEPLSKREQALIATMWERQFKAVPHFTADPFSSLSVAELRKVAEHLDIPRQVLSAFRNRTVLAASVPKRFMERLAIILNSSSDALTTYLQTRGTLSVVRSFKADSKPKATNSVSFEQLLTDANVPADSRRRLMADD